MSEWGASQWSAFGAIASVLVTLAVVGLTYRYVKATLASVALTQEMVSEMRETRLAQTRPLILVQFRTQGDQITLRVGNYGGGPAAGVALTFVPALKNAHGRDVGQEPLLHEDLPLLLPGEEHAAGFESFWYYFDPLFYLRQRSAIFTATASYRDPSTGTVYEPMSSALDLRPLAPFRQASEDDAARLLAEFQAWHEGEHPTPGDHAEFERVRKELREVGITVGSDGRGPDYRYLLRERGWQFYQNPHTRNYIALAIKGQGPHRGRAVVGNGWDWFIAGAFALHQAVLFDQLTQVAPE